MVSIPLFLFEKIENRRTNKDGGGGGKVGVERRRRTTMSPVLSSKFRLSALYAGPFTIDKGTIEALHVFNVDL